MDDKDNVEDVVELVMNVISTNEYNLVRMRNPDDPPLPLYSEIMRKYIERTRNNMNIETQIEPKKRKY